MKAYAAFGEKTLYGNETVGTILWTGVIGPDGRILKQWPQVKNAETHPRDVLAFLGSR
ncbi:MAG: hypothetical protein HY900_21305 [Deltaproteobacteria bacterium]|nr:hypothetical protein [Deltaproteobacteria bacterium]